MSLRVYTAQFDGHYPIGACAVVVARNSTKAREQLAERMRVDGLDPESIVTMEPIDLKTPGVPLFKNGDY